VAATDILFLEFPIFRHFEGDIEYFEYWRESVPIGVVSGTSKRTSSAFYRVNGPIDLCPIF